MSFLQNIKRLIVCCAILLMIPLALIADSAPIVRITIDCDTVAIGDTITASYEVSGEGSYNHVMYNWFIETEDNGGQPLESEFSDAMSGTIQFTPKFGTGAYLNFSVEDMDGRVYGFDGEYQSKRIAITGDYSVPPTIEIKLNKKELSVGDEIVAEYSVIGNGDYKNVMYYWFVYSGDNEIQIGSSGNTTDLQGEIPFTPSFGYGVFLSVTVEEENGRYYYCDSVTIPMTGDATIDPKATVAFDKTSVAVGEKVTASYSVTGGGEYTKVTYAWVYAVEKNGKVEWESYSSNYGESDNLNGTISLIPRYGEKLCISIGVEDKYGKYYRLGRFGEITISGFADDYEKYSFIRNSGNQTIAGGTSLIVCADADFEKLLAVQVDGSYVPQMAYSAWQGSTFVELKESYLNTLSSGKHDLTLVFSDGIAVTSFTIDQDLNCIAQLPQTGDSSHMAQWAMVLGLCVVGICLLKKKQHLRNE